MRVGGSPTSAALLDYLAESGEARQIVVDEGYRWKDHLASAHDYIQASPAPGPRIASPPRPGRQPPTPNGGRLWPEAEARTRGALEGQEAGELLEGEILAAVGQRLPEGANLLVASCMPIRDLDAFGFPGTGRLFHVLETGASAGSMDWFPPPSGSPSAASEAEAGQEASPTGSGGPAPTVGVLGDLAFFHDMNGLLSLKALRPNVVLLS